MAPIRRTVVVFPALLGVLLLTACGQTRSEGRSNIDPEQAKRLGLSEDAADPTARDLDKGYYRWKAKPEPAGTEAPTSPDRRSIGGPNP